MATWMVGAGISIGLMGMPVIAADLSLGQSVFENNCSALRDVL